MLIQTAYMRQYRPHILLVFIHTVHRAQHVQGSMQVHALHQQHTDAFVINVYCKIRGRHEPVTENNILT